MSICLVYYPLIPANAKMALLSPRTTTDRSTLEAKIFQTLKMSAVSPETAIDDQQTCQPPTAATPPRQLFIYGTLCAMPLLAWALTGDSANVKAVRPMCQPGRVHGYARRSLYNKDFPAVIEAISSSVDGYIITFQNTSQRRKLDDFEGEQYRAVLVTAEVGSMSGEARAAQTVEVDMYLWNGDVEAVSTEPWSLERFIEERLQDWLDLFDGMELIGDD